MYMERRHEPPCQIDASDSLSNFKIAFLQCVSSYFSVSCGAELVHALALVLLEEFFASHPLSINVYYMFSVSNPASYPHRTPPPPPHRSLFCYLNEIGREALRACYYPAKATALGCCFPSLAEGICCAVGYDPTK